MKIIALLEPRPGLSLLRKLRSVWEELRAKKLRVRFRRQQVIQGFMVDFYCHRAGLFIEVDGDVRDLQKEEDERREKVLTPSVLRTSPPNTTMKTWVAN